MRAAGSHAIGERAARQIRRSIDRAVIGAIDVLFKCDVRAMAHEGYEVNDELDGCR